MALKGHEQSDMFFIYVFSHYIFLSWFFIHMHKHAYTHMHTVSHTVHILAGAGTANLSFFSRRYLEMLLFGCTELCKI